MSDFFDYKEFPSLLILKNNYKEILKEAEFSLYFFDCSKITIERKRTDWVNDSINFKNIYRNKFEWVKSWLDDWYNLPIIHNDEIISESIKYLLPNTVKYLTSMKGIQIAGFSLMSPFSKIDEHNDATGLNQGSLAYHLCLIGKGDLYVDKKLIKQYPGRVIIFNSNKYHHVKNNYDTKRLILYIDFKIKYHCKNKKILSQIKEEPCLIS
jgi:aspartyl/asparaginyl beta-hydroxylase (cupin superfamily)